MPEVPVGPTSRGSKDTPLIPQRVPVEGDFCVWISVPESTKLVVLVTANPAVDTVNLVVLGNAI